MLNLQAGLHWKSWPLWQAVLEFEEGEYTEACTKIALSSGQSHDDNEKAEAESSEDFLKKEELRLYHIKTRDAAVERVSVDSSTKGRCFFVTGVVKALLTTPKQNPRRAQAV